MRQITMIVLGLGLALGAAALVSVLQSGLVAANSAEAAAASASAPSSASGPDEVLVAVLARDLQSGHRITPDDLSVEVVDASADLNGVVRTPLAVVGRVLIASGVKGELLRTMNLARPGTGASIAAQLQPGDRAATVTLRDVGAKVILYPGAKVDVLATMQLLDGRNQRRTATRTILQDRRVLAVDDEIAGGEVAAIDDDGRRRPVARSITVTLAVRPGEVEKLELASEQGTIGLVLRPMEGDVSAANSVATAETMFGESKARNAPRIQDDSAVLAPAPPQGLDADWWDMVVIRGGKSEGHRFDSESEEQEN
ncbi:MAG: Flp pilus assembly protein CpaB [Phycisphaerae bacterium]|nr:Flp pilus assembly protein CpaB [Phycisphaerae bacterium]